MQRYTHAVGSNPLSPYLSRLRELARNEDGSIAGLEGLPDAWGATCSNPRQRRVQDAIVDTEYYRPAQRHWRDQGLKTALSLAAIYDAEVQHGDGDDPDGVPAMLRRAQTSAHGTPRSGVAESRFVRAFLSVRKRTLLHAHDPETRQVWRQSVGRVAAWSYLVQTHQWRLRAPVRVRTRDYDLTIR